MSDGTKAFVDVIEEYFGGERNLYFRSSDEHYDMEGDTYLRWARTFCRAGTRIALHFGGSNGEVCLRVCSTPEELETLIKAMIR